MKMDNFPTNEMAQEMMEMITGNHFYDNSYVAKWLFQVMGTEMADAKRLIDELREQMFPETATWGIVYHEQKYGIPSSDLISLQERRNRVIQKRDIRAPMNPARLEVITTNHTGLPCTVTDPEDSYVFDISIDFPEETPIGVVNGLYDLIDRLKPSHLSYNVTADMEHVVFENVNTGNLFSLLFGIEFYTNQSCRTDQIFFEVYHAYRTRIQNAVDAYYVLPEHWRYGNLDTLRFMARKENGQVLELPGLSFTIYFKTGNTISCRLLQDTMYTFDGEQLFNGARRFNAKIIEEEL